MATPTPPQGQPPHHPHQPPYPARPYGHQPPYPPHPGMPQPGMPQAPGAWPWPPPPVKPGMSTGAKVGIGCGAIVGALVLMSGCAAILSAGSGNGTGGERQTRATAPSAATKENNETPPVTLTAEKAVFKPTSLHDGSDYTSVQVTVVNNSDDTVSVNPLYFEVTDSDGVKHSAEIFGADDNLQAVKLYKGEKVTGTVTFKGKITPAKVYFRKNGFSTTYSAPVE